MAPFPKGLDKDGWIKLALADRQYVVDPETSVVTRRIPHGGFFIRKPVAIRTHKKSGRVIFDMKFLGITKTVLLNRVVGIALIPNPKNLPEVNHIDGVKANNTKDNLEWADRSSQELHAQRSGLKSGRGSANSNAKLTVPEVLEIRSLEGKATPTELATQFGVSAKTIRDILSRKAWAHL